MKYKGDPNDITVTQTVLGKIFGVSQQRIGQLMEEEIVVRDETDKNGAVFLVDSIRNYYSSKNTGESGVNFWKEKGLHERAKRELAELKLQERRGELYEASTVEMVMLEHLTNFRTKLLGLPSKIAASLPADIRGEVYDNLTREIENCLDELSKNYKSEDFKSEMTDDNDINDDEE